MNYKWIAESRVSKKFKNLEVLNSYPVGKDGMHFFYEVICIDPSKPEIKSDKQLSWITKPGHKKRFDPSMTSNPSYDIAERQSDGCTPLIYWSCISTD
ncbi:MAG: hypothetical protein QGG23_08350, partial [Candidatus Bathyarchaeota archaeon]|nr:hypothetical protein [Candidatus Bathyarchaeota archaeon]